MRRANSSQTGPMWRSLDELRTPIAAQRASEGEFPLSAIASAEPNRRDFFKFMATALAAAGLNGCTRQPIEGIVPYVKDPAVGVPGEPLYFATAMPLSGYGTGILVKSREGRPIKVDGNPMHPSSLGGSNVWMQACLMDLYNVERLKSTTHSGTTSSWGDFLKWVLPIMTALKGKNGAGLRLLTGTVTSPTLAWQIRELLNRFPEARWHQWEPVNWDNSLEGARIAFGERFATHYDLKRASLIVALQSDFLYSHPDRLRHTREFSDARRVVAGKDAMNRLIALESSPTVTGSMADHRIVFSQSEIEAAVVSLAREAGLTTEERAVPERLRAQVKLIGSELKKHRGECVVIVGEGLSPAAHALEQGINSALGNFGSTVEHRKPAPPEPVNHLESIKELAEAMDHGSVELLIIMGGNPACDAPSDLLFKEKLARTGATVHLSLYSNQTSELCAWRVPQRHFLEGWSDCRAFDGTVTLMQPLIEPLFKGISEHQLIATLTDLQPTHSPLAIVKDYWRKQGRWEQFDSEWRQAVHDGLIAGSKMPKTTPKLREGAVSGLRFDSADVGEIEALFRPDPHLWDGRFSHNAWLQETPKPITKLVWDAPILVSPKLALREKLEDGDLAEVQLGENRITAPVCILAGQAENSLTVPLVGAVTDGGGFDYYRLRSSAGLWRAGNVRLRKAQGRYELVATQTHQQIHGEEREINREGTLAEYLKNKRFVAESVHEPARKETLYHPEEFEYPVKWGMAIDLTTCVGCNACVIACNIENNIPVVGKEQVRLNREMLWLRIDTYLTGKVDDPKFLHQPVPCMHCENAPCEYVCPVGATLHDHEGLNLQVYNRCIGTRYCSNNCPYKVRRFNFLKYAEFDSELTALRNNPEVSVRWRGVMEKCTYCVQRISSARIKAKEENRAVTDGEVRTACQEACPAEAIVFGVVTDTKAKVSRLKKHPLDFSMLGQLNTRPRTTYSAKLRNPLAEMEGAEQAPL